MKAYLLAGVAGLIAAGCVHAATLPQALADPRRPPADVARDPLRHPGEVLAFAGIKPGDRVADYFSGGGYYTRILSAAVGPKGGVYAVIPDEMARNCDPSEFAGTHELVEQGRWPNVRILAQPVTGFRPPEPLDLVWSSQNFHDLYDRFMEHADVGAAVRAIYASLKLGGVLLVVDHVAEAGSGLRDTDTLHRIDPEAIKRQVLAAGFRFEGESKALRNPADDHRLRVFDPRIRGRTDQVILKFRKPAA